MNRTVKSTTFEWGLNALLLLIKFALPLSIASTAFSLHRDEFLYYEQGKHLAPGLLENPPLIAILARISNWMGGSELAIKFWPALFGAATLALALRLVRGFGGGPYARLITGLAIICSVFLRTHYLFQPTFLEIFFWTLSCLFLQRFLQQGNRRDLFLLALSCALAWWSKYSALFFITALLLAFLCSAQRILFVRVALWQAAGLGLLLVLPNIIWQYNHNWPLAQHIEELRNTQLRYISKSGFLKEQVLMFVPSFFLWMGGLWWLFRKKIWRPLGWLYVFILLLLLFGSGKGYYSLGIYPMLLAAGGTWIESLLKRTSVVLRIAVPVLITILGIPMFPLMLPLQSPVAMEAFNKKYDFAGIGALKWEDQQNHPLQQDFADMLGWEELAKKTERFYQGLPDSIKNGTIIYARNYGYAGSLRYFAKDKNFAEKVISDNGSFLLWIPSKLPYKHLLFVGEEAPEKGDVVFDHFEKIIRVDSCTNPLSRQLGSPILFFQHADTLAFRLAERDIAEQKARFRR